VDFRDELWPALNSVWIAEPLHYSLEEHAEAEPRTPIDNDTSDLM
jgi:hypothetical protein